MPATNPRLPQTKYLACTAADGNIALGATFGALYLLNLDTTNDVWLTFDGSAAVATDTPGNCHLQAGRSLNLDDVAVSVIHGICLAGKTATLEIVCLPRSGSAGAGVQ